MGWLCWGGNGRQWDFGARLSLWPSWWLSCAARMLCALVSIGSRRPDAPPCPGLVQEQTLPFHATMLKQQSDVAAKLVGECSLN